MISRIKVDKFGRLIEPDSLVSAFEKKLNEMSNEEIFEKYQDADEYGFFIDHVKEPDWNNPDVYSNFWASQVDEDLIAKIEKGHLPTEDEIEGLREIWLEESLNCDADADYVDSYGIYHAPNENGESVIVLIITGGYSWSGVTISLIKAFSSSDEAYHYMDQNGWYEKT